MLYICGVTFFPFYNFNVMITKTNLLLTFAVTFM
jgi:hypothetical protein